MLRASIIITSYNDSYLTSLLSDIKCSNFQSNDIEILLVEAGSYSKDKAISALGEKAPLLKFWHLPEAPRTKSLNFLVNQSSANLIIRLDARSQIDPDYVERIITLSNSKKFSNVGGVMCPIGKSPSQKRIAKFMRHPLSLGGGKSRKRGFTGNVDSIYLGAFRADLMPQKPWFDEAYPQISEDSDLNFQIRRAGGTVFLDSSIEVRYFARETIVSFCRLAKNYGLARGLFFLKNKTITSFRQLVLPLGALFLFCIIGLALSDKFALYLLGSAIVCYALVILIASISLAEKFSEYLFYLTIFPLTHLSWVMGFYYAPYVYFKKNK